MYMSVVYVNAFSCVTYMYSLQREVLGRCTVDIRVCASPGRDRDVDERRMKGEVVDSPNGSDQPAPPTTRRGRKRGILPRVPRGD